tara:strand:- start:710 stop:1027 length:318 start_codon:yes stop_codon:yes gene_type:complete
MRKNDKEENTEDGSRGKNYSDKKDDKKVSGSKKETKVRRVELEKEHGKEVQKIITNVYSADFSVIDNCLEEIKKEVRKNGISSYACNNIYILLEETLKRVKLSNK